MVIDDVGQRKRFFAHNLKSHRGDRDQASMSDGLYSLYFHVAPLKRMAETLETRRFLGLTSLWSRPILKIARETGEHHVINHHHHPYHPSYSQLRDRRRFRNASQYWHW
jgi:hypothetical protein